LVDLESFGLRSPETEIFGVITIKFSAAFGGDDAESALMFFSFWDNLIFSMFLAFGNKGVT
jgi:hypothetical protein